VISIEDAVKKVGSMPAHHYRLEGRGVLEPGKYADISAWGRDLLTDDKALLDCVFVMKEGKEIPAHSMISDYE
jgi:imidazolonepropionase-like amidohydrolase